MEHASTISPALSQLLVPVADRANPSEGDLGSPSPHFGQCWGFLAQRRPDRLMTDAELGGERAETLGGSKDADCRLLGRRKLSAPRHLRGCALRSPAQATRRNGCNVDRACAYGVMTR
jgi:hypothetical protein